MYKNAAIERMFTLPTVGGEHELANSGEAPPCLFSVNTVGFMHVQECVFRPRCETKINEQQSEET